MTDRPIESSKSDLRRAMRERLAAISPDERRTASLGAAERLVRLDAFRHAGMIMVYLPLATELDAMPIVLHAFQVGKSVCAPRVDWERKDMQASELHSIADEGFEVDERGVRVPRDGRLVIPSAIDLVIVPGLAFDVSGRRLGRGGGYYDRFLSRLRRSTITVGLAFDAQIVAEVPTEACDMSVDLVVTDRRMVGGGSRHSSS